MQQEPESFFRELKEIKKQIREIVGKIISLEASFREFSESRSVRESEDSIPEKPKITPEAIPPKPETRRPSEIPKREIPIQPVEFSRKLKTAPAKTVIPSKSMEQTSREAEIGMKWFGLAGIILVVVAFAFFVKYAIDNQWIGPTTRIIGGIVFGILLVSLGSWFNKDKKYHGYDQTLIGGGFALLYFTFYAAYHFYGEFIEISRTADLFLLSLVIASAIAFSVRLSSIVIAGEAFLLGYFTAYLCGTVTTFTLFYNILLALGLIYLVYKKGWFVIGFAGLMATYLIHILWLKSNPRFSSANLLFLISYFVLFVMLSFAEQGYFSLKDAKGILKKKVPSANTKAVFYVISGLSYLIPMLFVRLDNTYLVYFALMALMSGVLSVWYGLAGLGVGLTAINYFVFVLWNNANPDQMAFALIFLIFLYSFFSLLAFLIYRMERKITVEEVFIAILNTALFFGFLFYKMMSDYYEYAGLFTLGMAVVNLGLCYTALKRSINSLFQTYLVLTVIFITLAIPVQLNPCWLSISWALESVGLLYLSYVFGNRTLLRLSQGVAIIALTAAFINSGSSSFKTVSLLITAACFWICAFMYQSRREKPDGETLEATESYAFSFAAAVLVMFMFYHVLRVTSHVNVAWNIAGIALLATAYFMRFKWIQLSGYLIHICAAVSISYIVDAEPGNYIIAFLPSIITFFVCASIHIRTPIALQREEGKSIGAAYAAAATVLLTIFLAMILQGAWVSVSWAVEAIVILSAGFIMKERMVRYAGIALFVLTLVKVLAIDMASLEMAYRVVSLFGVGVVLLVASYIYYRNREQIEQWVGGIDEKKNQTDNN